VHEFSFCCTTILIIYRIINKMIKSWFFGVVSLLGRSRKIADVIVLRMWSGSVLI